MMRNTNVIKYPMKLSDNVVDLGGQVARVDGHCASKLPRQGAKQIAFSVYLFNERKKGL